MANPYTRPNPTAKAWALLEEPGLLEDVEELPKPV